MSCTDRTCISHCALNLTYPYRGVLFFLVLPLVFFLLNTRLHAEEESGQEKWSVADELKSLAKEPEIIIEGMHDGAVKTHTTIKIKEAGKAQPETELVINEELEPVAKEAESQVQQPQSENSVEGEIESRDEVAYDPMARSIYPDAYYRIRKLMRDWERKLGLEITFSYDMVGQLYGDDVESNGGLAGDASLSGRWLLFGEKQDLPMYLTFRVRRRDALTEIAPSQIGPETGLFWKTVNGFNDSGFQVPSLYFSQELHHREVIMRYGQFSIDDFFDSHRFRSAKKYFLNYAFSGNPSVNFPSYGAGLVLQWNPNQNWELIGGASNIQGTEQGQDINLGIDSTALFEAAQLRYRIAGDGGREAELRVMAWNNDGIPEEGLSEDRGISATLGIDGLSPGEEFAFRFAAARGNSTLTDVHFFAAYGKQINSYDHWGIGVAAGRSSQSAEWQVMTETYYRWWVFKELIITPDFQFIVGDHLDRDTNVCVVAGLRFGFIF